jgi:hypothetical protein
MPSEADDRVVDLPFTDATLVLFPRGDRNGGSAMAAVTMRVRAVYWRSLYLVLFPLVFLITWAQMAPAGTKDVLVKSAGFVTLMTLGLACAAATGGRL